MVCYAYDDYEGWISPYPYEVYTSQLKKLLVGWEKGIALLSDLPQTGNIAELLQNADSVLLLFGIDTIATTALNAY